MYRHSFLLNINKCLVETPIKSVLLFDLQLRPNLYEFAANFGRVAKTFAPDQNKSICPKETLSWRAELSAVVIHNLGALVHARQEC